MNLANFTVANDMSKQVPSAKYLISLKQLLIIACWILKGAVECMIRRSHLFVVAELSRIAIGQSQFLDVFFGEVWRKESDVVSIVLYD